jgi:hypothetical protein
VARPSKYKPEYNEEAKELCMLGYTDQNLADYFKITTTCLNDWKKKYPAFSASVKEGKEGVDREIVQALFDKAKAGDTTAMIFWLKNRQKNAWRDKQSHEVTGKDGEQITINYKPKGDK